MNEKLKTALASVKKPARYAGGEYGSVLKDRQSVDLRVAFCFPDLYEIGMSHLGSKIMYGLLNSMDGVWCERVFAPDFDMEDVMRRLDLPLYALESGDAVAEFDILAFTLQYEMNYTAVLNMLSMAGVPLESRERGGLTPLVIAGGPCVYNLEPMADFFDIIVVGEGEAVMPRLVSMYREARRSGASRSDFLRAAAQVQGVYVPSLYEIAYTDSGAVASITAAPGIPQTVTKAVCADLDGAFFPETCVVPSTESVFDRAQIELFRGCRRGCRFCQAGYTYRPIRARSAATLKRQAESLVSSSGWDEISLTSLSSSDYPQLEQLCGELVAEFEPLHVNLALPSLRVDNFNLPLMESIQKVRKSGLTFAPEAGSQRLRDIINKNIDENDLLDACRVAFGAGYNSVKLYFMLGLPGESDDDLLGIPKLVKEVIGVFRRHASNPQRGIKISVGVSTFVPKAQTPFQWFGQTPKDEVLRRQALLMDNLKIKNVTYSLHTYDVSFYEAVFARGDRRLAPVIRRAWQFGCRLDGWDEHFDRDKWAQAFADCGVDPLFYAARQIPEDEILPWDHIFSGVTKEYMLSEYQASLRGIATPDCKAGCRMCGAQRLMEGPCHV